MITALFVVTVLGLALTAFIALIRIVIGPTILDRMIASDVLLTTLMLALGTDAVVRGHTHSIAMMTVIAATATFATITVARYVKRKGSDPAANPDASEPAGHDDYRGEAHV